MGRPVYVHKYIFANIHSKILENARIIKTKYLQHLNFKNTYKFMCSDKTKIVKDAVKDG